MNEPPQPERTNVSDRAPSCQVTYQVDYQVTISAPDRDALPRLWQSLEARATPNFFLSWLWVDAWLTTFNPDFRLVQIQCDSVLVGLGLLTCNEEIRHRILRSRMLRLGRTGNAVQDQIWIEYNGLLLDRQHEHSAPAALLQQLLQQDDWDEFELGASDESVLQRYAHPDCTAIIRWSAPAYGVNLAALREAKTDYLASLSRNTRYQINRSRKLYAADATLTFSTHTTPDAILSLWPQLADLHQARWGNAPGQSGFANPDFVRFHQHLIKHGGADDRVELCTLHRNDELLGCLYNFLYKGRVYFYLSGLRAETDPHLKPGLLLHAMAIQHYLERHYDYYDFMGGEARYKQSLGNQHCELQLVSFQRPRLKLKLEQLARRIKHLTLDKQSTDDHPQ